MTISAGYTIADIAAIKALTPSQRTNGYARLCLEDTNSKPFWYVFIASSTDTADDNFVLMPDDSPTSGRWFKTATDLGFTPENVNNKSTNTSLGSSDTFYPTQKAVKEYVDMGLAAKQNSLGFTPENTGNKSTTTSLGTSDTLYPTQNAVKTYADNLAATKTNKLVTTNRQTASYTLVLGDADKLVEINNASANNLTIPPNADVAFPIGTQILVSQYGAGQTTLVAGSGVTLRSDTGKLKISSQYSGATLIKIDTNEWYVFGSLAT